MLSDRRQRVLAALIEEYIECALPVGSRTLTERYQLGVSPATVRNDLSALEDAGYIKQPHTSAGRIPTDAGYRAFVDDLLASGIVEEERPHEDVVQELRSSASELDSLMNQTSAALSRLTDCLSIVVAPSLASAHIRQISLVSLSNHRALIVLVTEDGHVLDRHVAFPEEVYPEELNALQSLINTLLAGKSFAELRQQYDDRTIHLLQEPLGRFIIEEIVLCIRDEATSRAHLDGVSSLMRKPEFSNAQSLLPVMHVLEDDTVLLNLFDEAFSSETRTFVRIGSENTNIDLSGVSVVAKSYGRGEGAGIVAVIGPTRMDYSKVIRAVRAAQQALGDQ